MIARSLVILTLSLALGCSRDPRAYTAESTVPTRSIRTVDSVRTWTFEYGPRSFVRPGDWQYPAGIVLNDEMLFFDDPVHERLNSLDLTTGRIQSSPHHSLAKNYGDGQKDLAYFANHVLLFQNGGITVFDTTLSTTTAIDIAPHYGTPVIDTITSDSLIALKFATEYKGEFTDEYTGAENYLALFRLGQDFTMRVERQLLALERRKEFPEPPIVSAARSRFWYALHQKRYGRAFTVDTLDGTFRLHTGPNTFVVPPELKNLIALSWFDFDDNRIALLDWYTNHKALQIHLIFYRPSS